MKKRILFINRMEPYTAGGARRVVWELGKELARQNWDVHFFYASYLTNYPEVKNISFHRVPSSPDYFASTYSFLLKGPNLFKKLVENLNPDIVYDNTNPSPFLPAYFISAKQLVVRIHHLARGDIFTLKSGIINPIATILLEECFRLTKGKHVIVDSQSTLERARPLIKKAKSISIIYPGIDPIEYPSSMGNCLRTDTLQVFCVCRMAKSKGIDFLLRAWKIIEEKSINAKLVIAGKGPQEKEYRKLVADLGLKNCTLLGFITEEEKKTLLSQTHIYAFPTLIEGLPISLLEAMQYGLPIVTTNTWGAKDVVENNKNGFLVSPKSSEALAEALIDLLENENMRHHMSGECRQMVKKYYLNKVLEQESKLLNNFYLDKC